MSTSSRNPYWRHAKATVPSPIDKSATVGLLAGWGRFPIVIAEAMSQQGYRVVCLGIKDHADPALRDCCDEYCEVSGTRLGEQIRYFLRQGVTQATMAGKVHKVKFFGKFFLLKNLPDWKAVNTFYHHFLSHKKDRRDDTLLAAFVEAYAQAGITMVPATDFSPNLLVQNGLLAGRRLSNTLRKDIEFGWRLAKAIGAQDIGQSVAVKGRAVLAVEAVEGTDECILRAGALCPSGGFSVVKVAKPQQDMRFDVPTIGPGTVETLAKAGGRVLAVESEKTIVIDQQQVVDLADRHNITIVATHRQQIEDRLDAA